MSKRVLVAGLFHETHIFLEELTSFSQFTVRRGDELLEAEGDGSPLSGVLDVARKKSWELIPVIDLRATPGATVEDAVFELFWKELREAAVRELPEGIDGIYLVLHGAMVTESSADVEGELIDNLRGLEGVEGIPICGVLDLHGNLSGRTIKQTQGLIAYRCNPHTDAREAAVAAAELLDQILQTARKPVCLWEHPPVMWPPTGTGTADDLMRSLEEQAREWEASNPDVAAVNVFAGFSFADTPETGVSFSVVTFGDPKAARKKLQEMIQWAIDHRHQGNVVEPSLEETMPKIVEHYRQGEGPIVIVEPSDNIGGGAPGDGTSVLRALIENEIENSAVVINDPQSVTELQKCSSGERVKVSIGGKGSRLTEGPVELKVRLLSLSDGGFDLEDPHSHLASMCGSRVEMGPCAVVSHQGVQILLTSRKTPPFDLGQLRSQGIEPERLSVIGVKAAVAHRQAYDPITFAGYTVSTPGPCSSDLKLFPYRRVRRPVFPLEEI